MDSSKMKYNGKFSDGLVQAYETITLKSEADSRALLDRCIKKGFLIVNDD
jgi:hypothetical protein